MATTNEWYQRSVRDYEDKIRDSEAEIAFLRSTIADAEKSITTLRAQARAAPSGSEEQALALEKLNNLTSRRNELEGRLGLAEQDLSRAESSLTQAQADLARVNQGAPAQTLPEQPPSAPPADPAARQAQAPVTTQNAQLATIRQPADVTDPGEVPGVTVSDRLQTDPGEVPGETVFGPGFATDTGGVPSQELIVRSRLAQPQPDPFEVDGAGIGLTDEEIFAQDNPITPENTQDTFAGPGYGFVYNEDGELLPADSAEADRIRSTPDDTTVDFAGDGYGFDYDENGELIPADSAEAARIRSEAVPQLDPYEIDGLGAGELTEEEIQQQDNTNAEAAQDAAGKQIAQEQFTLQQRNNTTTQGDWRVRIRLLPGASYLYKDSVNYLMQPLRDSDGVVFPYVPTITTNYVARYDPYELVHANYRGFFYKNSHVGEIQLNGVFTAQDTAEATYLLAVIHFFRSCTKMFYGQDSEFRGSPPPLVELSGYGEFQFNNHPCLVSNFNYTLPNGVDYIRVSPNNQGVNLSNRRNPISTGSILDSAENRRKNNLLPPGAEPGRIDLGFSQGVNGTGQTTYVPTKMEIQLTMLPVQTREQVSKGFRLDEFARGNLLRGGFW